METDFKLNQFKDALQEYVFDCFYAFQQNDWRAKLPKIFESVAAEIQKNLVNLQPYPELHKLAVNAEKKIRNELPKIPDTKVSKNDVFAFLKDILSDFNAALSELYSNKNKKPQAAENKKD